MRLAKKIIISTVQTFPHLLKEIGDAHRGRRFAIIIDEAHSAFTSTPKNKALEFIGEALPADAEGKTQHRPFHSYIMKQAVDEGFILDVLKNYTPAYQNAKRNTPQTARIALAKVMLDVLKDDTEVYKQFVQNPSFKRFVTEAVFDLTK